MVAQSKALISEEEYLVRERAAETKSEYRDGEVVAMVGASREHTLIVTDTHFALYGQLRDRPCEVYPLDMRVRIPQTRRYFYPDLIVVCDEPRFGDDYVDNLLNPTVIIEVLSPSTAGYDRGEKFLHYRTIPSLREYLLIAQDAYRIEHFARQGEQHWLLTVAEGLEASVHLASIDCTLRLADVYKKVADLNARR
jgi:Uma2 family endonuclease